MFFSKKNSMPSKEIALPGRNEPIETAEKHFVSGRLLKGPYPDQMLIAVFGLGCFWGAERKFWSLDGVWISSVGYCAGLTLNPTYEEVCTGQTGHNEVVQVVFDPGKISYLELLKTFFESHNPTQGMRQGNDIGTQYRSAIFTHSSEQKKLADDSLKVFNLQLKENGFSDITTDIAQGNDFFYAEDYHQQYLSKNPNGYCGLGGTGVSYPLD